MCDSETRRRRGKKRLRRAPKKKMFTHTSYESYTSKSAPTHRRKDEINGNLPAAVLLNRPSTPRARLRRIPNRNLTPLLLPLPPRRNPPRHLHRLLRPPPLLPLPLPPVPHHPPHPRRRLLPSHEALRHGAVGVDLPSSANVEGRVALEPRLEVLRVGKEPVVLFAR